MSTDESSGKKGLKAKLMKARDAVKRLKEELTEKKAPAKGSKARDKKGAVKKKKKKKKKKSSPEARKVRAHGRRGDVRDTVKKRKKRAASPSPENVKAKAKDDWAHEKETREGKGKRKKAMESSYYSEDEDEGLFGEAGAASTDDRKAKGRKDRGPFGRLDVATLSATKVNHSVIPKQFFAKPPQLQRHPISSS